MSVTLSIPAIDNNVVAPVEISTIDDLKRCKERLFERIDDAKRNPMPIDRKIVWLQQLSSEIERISSASIRLEESAMDQIDQLPWWHFLEKLGGHIKFGLGTHSNSLVAAQAVRVGVTVQMSELGQRELKELDRLNAANDPQTMPILHLYHLVAALQPEDKQYLKGLVDRLLIEQAYSKAI